MQSLASRLRNQDRIAFPEEPVRIAFVITDLDAGGAEKAMAALVLGLDRSRWNPSIVCLDAEGELAEKLRDAGIEVTCLGVNRRRPIAAIWALNRALRRHRPAIVHSFLFHANLAAKLSISFVGRPWIVGGIRVAEREKRWHLLLDRWTQRLSSGAVCVSSDVKAFSIRDGGIAEDRLVVIPNGIAPERFDDAQPIPRAKLGLPEQAKIALFVGRITSQKDVPMLLDAFGRISLDHPDWRLVLVGDGPDRNQLEALANRDPSLSKQVVWLGRRDDVPGLMKASDLLVLSSLWEGMPNVVLEAMAAGLPVVATKVEGVSDLIVSEGDEVTGWVSEPGDPEKFAANLDEAMQYRGRRKRYGANGRKRVEKEFTMKSVIEAYESVWAGVLKLSLDRAKR